ncbi:TonB family protein [Vibrio ostreicida]|uniref:Energy transducer TonB n=1 Tax=Vibrio ostreicida TaxID=526588 RepID=A0ABT8C0R1_9VIBR|nr:energy transducer TonB [Vibrio ostreicida]MDN3612523.1 energy transducer TonB [Vibrio ostreicida]NPD09148.1 energy transducer TonB [Vibrio ostreicida]
MAGVASVSLHATIVLFTPETTLHAMPAGNQSTSVSINFRSAPSAASSQPAAKPRTEQTVKDLPSTSKSVTKPSSTVKTAKPLPVKADMKQATPAKQPPVTVTKPMTKPEATTQVKPKKEVDQNQPDQQPVASSQGASAKPVLITKPTLMSKATKPIYPRMARKRGIEGVAVYEVWIDKDGNQVKQVLVSSSGAATLDKSALKAIKQWQFSPYRANGLVVAHRVKIPVRFNLD